MDRNELHQQIVELADKIGHLNDTLSRSRKIHPVEIDLLRLYVRELVAHTEVLAELSGVPKENLALPSREDVASTIPEPVSFEQLSAAIPLEVVAPEPIQQKAAPQPTAPEPVEIEKAPEPVKAPEPPHNPPVVERVTEPAPSPPPVIEKAPEPVVEVPFETVLKQEPIKVEPVAAPGPSAPPTPPATEIVEVPQRPTAPSTTHSPPQPTEDDTYSPPPRRQVTIQSDAAAESKFIKPEPGKAQPVYHSIEEEHDAPSINDQFTQQSDLFQGAKHSSGKGLKEMMDLGERFLFIKELFAGDLSSFERATDALNGISNMDQAKAYIEGVLRQKYNWEGKEPIVRQFYTLVERRFEA